jgi:hypothetical protein
MYRWLILTLALIPLLLSALRSQSPDTLLWWTTDALEKVRPFDPPPEELTNSIQITAARNEFEPFQIVLRSDSRDIEGVDFQVSDLKGPGGAVLSKDKIAIYFERFVNLPQPSNIEGKAGEWPDALIPRVDRYYGERRNAFPFNLARGRNQPVWFEVYVPPSSAPGAYKGAIAVSIHDKQTLSVPITLQIWKFVLPSTSSLRNSFGFNGTTALRQHLGAYTNDEDLYRFTFIYRKAALEHRLTLHGGAMNPPRIHSFGDRPDIDWKNYDAEVGPFLDGTAIHPNEPLAGAKATTVDLPRNETLQTDQQKIVYWRAVANHFRQKGWFSRLFNYLWDEPKQVDSAELLRRGRLVHSADPEIKNAVTASLHRDWVDVVDIWIPLVNCFASRQGFRDFCVPSVPRSEYTNVWWYQSCASHGCNIVGGPYFTGWPNYMIDTSPVANRIFPWLAWKYGIQGELYYSINEAYARSTDAWDNLYLFGGNGDGTLLYPGRTRMIGGKTDIPIESIRLKLIREGLEDYEYLVLLSKHDGDAAVSDLVGRIVTNAYSYDRHPDRLYALRRQIAERISKE